MTKRNGDKPAVHMVPVGELVPSEYNPRRHDEGEAAQLRTSLERFGMCDPLIVNGNAARRNRVIGGHFRLRVAQDMGMAEVPCVYVDIATEERERELNLRLNRNTGTWDWEKLVQGFDSDLLRAVGFTEAELRSAIGDVADLVLPDLQGRDAETHQITVYYPDAEFEEVQAVLDRQEGKTVSDKFLAVCRQVA